MCIALPIPNTDGTCFNQLLACTVTTFGGCWASIEILGLLIYLDAIELRASSRWMTDRTKYNMVHGNGQKSITGALIFNFKLPIISDVIFRA